VAPLGVESKVCKVLVGNPEGKRPLGRKRYRWMGSEWILGRLGRGRWRALVNTVMNVGVLVSRS
jgi:hypothetical protein